MAGNVLDHDMSRARTLEESSERRVVEEMDVRGVVVGLRRNRRDDEACCNAQRLARCETRIGNVLEDLEKRKPGKLVLMLPKFKISVMSDLIPAFADLGLKLAFDGEKADFGGITGRPDGLGLIWISQIKHQAFLEVNEEGSEAAAATAVEFKTRSSPARFQANRPFLFLLVDRQTDAILFMGRVKNPLKEQE